MIYDILENVEQYTGLFPNLDTAIAYITETDLNSLPLGKTEIDGENVWVNVVEVQTQSTDSVDFETHSAYMDIHIDLEGTEIVEIALGDLAEVKPYDEEADMAVYKADMSCAAILGEDRFMVCMVEEPHKPAVAVQGSPLVRKCIFKVAV